MLFSETLQEQFASAWALAWLGECRAWIPSAEPDYLGRLFTLWQEGDEAELKRMAGWALAALPLRSRDGHPPCSSIDRFALARVLDGYDELMSDRDKAAVLIPAWYLHALDDTEIARRARDLLDDVDSELTVATKNLRELLKHVGDFTDDQNAQRQKKRTRARKP
jgi:hypothetical protein